jgi:CubicO group peptidase (beta-lactamase class C family)
VNAPDLSAVVALLEDGIAADWHDCSQAVVSIDGQTVLEIAVGESHPGRALRTDDVMLWYSAGKPLTTVAVLQLWEQRRLELDDLVATFIPGWGGGKERATVRHLLTHTGGFPMFARDTYDREVTYAEGVAAVAAAPAEWEPGTAAGYHATSAWRILGAIVEAVDGRPIDQYVRDEVLAPLGAHDASLGVPIDEQARLGDRIVPVVWKGHVLPKIDADGSLSMAPYRIDNVHNEPWHIAKVEPAGGMRGPASSLARFYESLLGFGPRLLDPHTVDTMTAVHRYGMKDGVLGRRIPWGLGVQVEFTGGTTRRAFGHGGMASSRGLADPICGLVIVVIANGLPNFIAAERRVFEVTNAVYSALGADVAPYRKPVEDLGRAFGLST